MEIRYNAATEKFDGADGYTYKIFDTYGHEIVKPQDQLPLYSLALRVIETEEELLQTIAKELQDKGVEGSLCQLCTRTGAIAGCPKQKSSIYKSLTERESPVPGWEATPSDRMVRVQVGDLVIPTLVKGWSVHKCPLFQIRLKTQEVSEFIKIAQIMFRRLESATSWSPIDAKVISAKKEKLETLWNEVYDFAPLYFERPDEEDDE